MARPVMLGNGQLTVGLNEQGLVHDLYYPYVGLNNLTTARRAHHKIGIWVDGVFSWVGDGWKTDVTFEDDALISTVSMEHDELKVRLECKDFVDYQVNAFARHITVKNLHDAPRNIRIFMHQIFEISQEGRADTALYVPEGRYLLDYKGHCNLLIYGETSDKQPFDQFSVGNYGIEGKQGTYMDAEDGELSNNPVEHGGVDSVLRFSCAIAGHSEQTIDYWIVAADSHDDAKELHEIIKKDGLALRLSKTRNHWHDWMAIGYERLKLIDEPYRVYAQKSLLIIKAHIDKRGGIIASCDSSIYNYGRDYYSYVWTRDGAYAIWPLIRMGYTEEPKLFFEFCRDILSTEGYLRHKYQPDKAYGSSWHPLIQGTTSELAIQEDGTAAVLYMLGEYHAATKDDDFVRSLYSTFIQPAANFMMRFIDEATGLPHASYDLWEEKFITSTYTVACVYEALQVAADFADAYAYPDDAVKWRETAKIIARNSSVFFDEERQAFRKGFLLREDGSLALDNTIDVSSQYGVMMFAGSDFGEGNLEASMKTIEATLLDQSPSGGAPRYEHDHYFESQPAHLGNPWFVTTLWVAQYYVRNQQVDKAQQYVDWTMQHMLPSGVLSEQIHPETGAQVGVSPLVWSHAEYINTVLDIAQVKRAG